MLLLPPLLLTVALLEVPAGTGLLLLLLLQQHIA
eukprot:COSAG05_NODE_2521_length_2949_cov_152.630175_3_plen_34_part_00